MSGLTAPPANREAEEYRRAVRLTGGMGILFAILFVCAMVTLDKTPHFNATNDEILAFYQNPSHQIIDLGGLYLLPLSAIAFLWFTAAIHAWVEASGQPVDRVMSTVQMLGGVSFVTLALAAAASSIVTTFANPQYLLTPDLARQFPLLGRTLLVVFGMRMAALFIMSTAKLGLSSGLLPRWFLGLSAVTAVVLFVSASLNIWLTVLFPVWVLVLCATVWLREAPDFGPHRDIEE